MKFQEIKQLIKVVEKSNINEIEIEEGNVKLRISKNSSHQRAGVVLPNTSEVTQTSPSMNVMPAPVGVIAVPNETKNESVLNENIEEIKSPMVGTFYRAPAPDAEPYIEIGDEVKIGQTLCIIEAMKLMNEIQSEVSGKVIDILVENSQPVEYDKVLFLIEKT
jgi:acetyl-CoA carboxylase biotin carboxyl carrier protein